MRKVLGRKVLGLLSQQIGSARTRVENPRPRFVLSGIRDGDDELVLISLFLIDVKREVLEVLVFSKRANSSSHTRTTEFENFPHCFL
jgi:hypothetical protein